MEEIKTSKFALVVDKLAVASEPGLTNAQLMLTNHDLKPGMYDSGPPESRLENAMIDPCVSRA